MNRRLLVCISCQTAIFLNSSANTSPRWTGEIGDPVDKRIEIDEQDDEKDFKTRHIGHALMVVELEHD